MKIRDEKPADFASMDRVCEAAFATVSYGSPHDSKITGLLRDAGALAVSLVADEAGAILGHVSFSPVIIGDTGKGWFCLGPVAVAPDQHGTGIGSKLIRDGLARLKEMGALGCVLLGNPAYYARFGFDVQNGLLMDGEASPYLQVLTFQGDAPGGEVTFHPAFFEG
ncbi:GNAT family N-acetyltransferase [Halocynthiibacter styelae]|uniref:N-acetyltransferase n=1 Tax=Halocynthiibacter styelae TaxID=2761955 RepID=A0A8J7IYM8_9RHOB|nr:N-acetyltransferase [Paenihalocynthiibacter styelae]MBI1494680.1 N-acetyltransferase [Paenihalocynthiibacter styelae]